MEFYAEPMSREVAEKIRFNSQRDGILQKPSKLGQFKIKSFNSQRDGILRGKFYASVKMTKGFNSQRDGILPKEPQIKQVFIPGFNSQRDGILPFSPANNALKTPFQFPTGWNSTHSHHPYKDHKADVSIPNGMEFYLLAAARCSLGCKRFQFPTGWNST